MMPELVEYLIIFGGAGRGQRAMKKQLKMGVIGLLAMAGLVLIASEPSEGVDWFAVMFWKSVAGFGLWGVCALLYKALDMAADEEEYSDEW